MTWTASSDTPARTGVWAGIGAIAMSFAAYTSAMVMGERSASWQPVHLPPILYLNTVLLLASSLTLEAGRRRIANLVDHPDWEGPSQVAARVAAIGRLRVTMALGLLFLVGQCLAWRDLVRQGLFLSTNPSSSFFYVFTGLHGLHLLGGLAALGYVLWRAQRSAGPGPASALSAVAVYWHFMDVLWLYLLAVLAIWL